MDDFALALALELEEQKQAREGFVGKMPADSDYALALALMHQERHQFLESLKLARGIDGADLGLSERLVREIQEQDNQDLAGRRLAIELEGCGDSSNRVIKSRAQDHVLNDLLDTYHFHENNHHNLSDIAGTSSSMSYQNTWMEPREPVAEEEAECLACSNPCSNKAPCKHFYCSPCIKRLCEASLKDRSLIPIRCCQQPLPNEWVEKALTRPRDLARYLAFQKELTTHSVNDLDPEYARIIVTNGWKLCPRCRVGIEKVQDCNHMTCTICRFEFCYTCAKGWEPRECTCALWSEDELARIIDDRAPGAGPAERARLEHLFQHHDEHQHRWAKMPLINTMKKCGGCRWVCNQWYFRCFECATNYCGMCAFNGGRA